MALYSGQLTPRYAYTGAITPRYTYGGAIAPEGADLIATPASTSSPTLSGLGVVGETLTVSKGAWSGIPSSYAYQWQRNTGSGWLDISGATGTTYTLTTSDVGQVRCVVTATNAEGSGTATTAALDVIASGVPVTSLEWDEDLSALPALTFDAALSSGCTEAQAAAALSVSSGALILDTQAAVDAGADAEWTAVWWLAEPVEDPVEFYARWQRTSSALGSHIVSAGLLTYYLDDGETVSDGPPDEGATEAAPYTGITMSADGRTFFWNFFPTTSTFGASGVYHAVRHCVSRYRGIVYSRGSSGTSYATLGGWTDAHYDVRTRTLDAGYPASARWRPALVVRRPSTGGQMTLRIDTLRLVWR